jgi:hypothetical protein
MAILAPSTPSDFGNEIDDLSEAYSPQQLQQKYAITKELKYLLALQKVTSIVQEAQRSLTASQEQTEGNVKDQLERGLMERAEDVIGLLGGQQPQGQTQMVAQGGLINRASGGIVGYAQGTPPPPNYSPVMPTTTAPDVEEGPEVQQITDFDAIEWIQENPLDAASLGLMLIPGVGWLGVGIGSALRGAGLAYKALQGIDKAKALKKVGDAAKSTVTRTKEVPEMADERFIPLQTGTRTVREFSLPRATATSGIAAGTAQGLAALTDDEEESSGNQGAVNQGIGGQGTQGQVPMGTKIDDFEIESIINRGETPNYRQQAQDSVDTLAQIAGGEDRLKTVEERALQDTSKVREEGAEAFMGRAGETGIRDNLVKLFEEADADLAALNNPEEMSRDLRIATFANVGGTGVGQIFGNMSKAFLETKTAQKELLRAAIEKRTGNALKVIELDKELFMAGEAEGLKLYEIAEAAKSEALSDLTGFSRDRRKQIVNTMQILQKSDDDRIKNALAAIKEISNSLNRRNRADLVSYAGAQLLLALWLQMKEVQSY